MYLNLRTKKISKKCVNSLLNCKINEQDGVLVQELKKEILKKAVLDKEQDQNKNKKKNKNRFYSN